MSVNGGPSYFCDFKRGDLLLEHPDLSTLSELTPVYVFKHRGNCCISCNIRFPDKHTMMAHKKEHFYGAYKGVGILDGDIMMNFLSYCRQCDSPVTATFQGNERDLNVGRFEIKARCCTQSCGQHYKYIFTFDKGRFRYETSFMYSP